VFVHNGRMWPANKERIRRAMFRPQVFEASRRGIGDQSLVGSLLPPDRDGPYQGYVKESAAVSLLSKIAHTVNMTDYQRLESALADPLVTAELMKNASVVSALQILADNPPTRDGKDFVKQAFMSVPPTVIQISKIAGGFRVKTANPTALSPTSQDMDRPTAVDIVGQDVVRKVEDGGTVTVSTNAAVKDSMYEAGIKPVEEFGQYKVMTKDGREIEGWVFPRVMDLDGTQLPQSVFSNGSESAFQGKIAGSLVGKGTNLIDVTPEGQGIFYLARQGSAVALIPVTVTGEVVDGEGAKKYLASTQLGEKVELFPTAGVQTAVAMGEGKYAIPDDMGFMPLTKLTKLVEDPAGFASRKEAKALPKTANLLCDNNSYSLKGMGVTKLAAAVPVQYTDADQTMFNLVTLGLAPHEAREKMADAHKHHNVAIRVADVTTTLELYEQCKVAAAEVLQKMPPKLMLLKLAAETPDPTSVDHVLSLGFLNPENIDIFIDAVPDLEDTVSRLCEMLVASRLGMDVNTSALERGIKNMEEIVQDLRAMTRQPRQSQQA